MNETARQRFRQSAADEENKCLPKYGDESDIGLYRALELLRHPLCFDVLVGKGFRPQENPASFTRTSSSWSTAMSGHAMRGGRQAVEFTIASAFVHLGIIRPVSLTDGIDLEADWRGSVYPTTVSSSNIPAVAEKLRYQRTVKWGDSNVHCCAYYCYDGHCYWTDWNNGDYSDWQGSERLTGSGTRLLLDLEEGTLSVFKNGRRLGVMKDGLGGEYVWFVSVYSPCTIRVELPIKVFSFFFTYYCPGLLGIST